jgi:hypothetical protein
MKKIRGDKPIGVTIYLYMKISQGNSLCNYLYFKQAKISCFSFHFFLLQNWRTGGWNRSCPVGRVGTREWGEVAGELSKRVNMVKKMCTHVCKSTNDT